MGCTCRTRAGVLVFCNKLPTLRLALTFVFLMHWCINHRVLLYSVESFCDLYDYVEKKSFIYCMYSCECNNFLDYLLLKFRSWNWTVYMAIEDLTVVITSATSMMAMMSYITQLVLGLFSIYLQVLGTLHYRLHCKPVYELC